MYTLDITSLLGPDLKTRNTVADVLLLVNNCHDSEVTIDFANVKFATRSFIDEYYNTFMLHRIGECKANVSTVNVPDDIKFIFNAVSKTQTGRKTYKEPANTHIHHFKTVEELNAWLLNLPL